jgi:hypothetical protein
LHNLSLQCLVSSNLVAKVELFVCTIPHEGSMVSWLLPVVVAVAVAVEVAVAVAVAMA